MREGMEGYHPMTGEEATQKAEQDPDFREAVNAPTQELKMPNLENPEQQ